MYTLGYSYAIHKNAGLYARLKLENERNTYVLGGSPARGPLRTRTGPGAAASPA
jgi:hypothetical protein